MRITIPSRNFLRFFKYDALILREREISSFLVTKDFRNCSVLVKVRKEDSFY